MSPDVAAAFARLLALFPTLGSPSLDIADHRDLQAPRNVRRCKDHERVALGHGRVALAARHALQIIDGPAGLDNLNFEPGLAQGLGDGLRREVVDALRPGAAQGHLRVLRVGAG